jgi:hypothetical protein
MSLDKKLNRLESKGEEKKINLRIAKGKADVLEILAEHYGVTVSTLIREMIDNSLIELQKELIVVNKGLGINITQSDNKYEVRYLPDIISILAPNIELSSYGNEDFPDLEELDNFSIEHARLSVEYGLTNEATGISSISNKEYNFTKKNNKV